VYQEGITLEKRRVVNILLIIAAVSALFIQIGSATSDCPNCKVIYENKVPQLTSGTQVDGVLGSLSLLDPSTTAFMSDTQVHLASIILGLL
jgi:hypothetical protein